MDEDFIPFDDNDMINELCPKGGHHQIKYDTDEKMIICKNCGKLLYSKKYYDKQPPSDANSSGVG